MDKMNTKFFDYNIFSGTLDTISNGNKMVINTINQYSYCIAERDLEFKDALLKSDVLLPDGVAITASIKFLSGRTVKKIAGADIHEYLLRKMNSIRGKCFYLGSSEATLDLIKSRLEKEYPFIQVRCYSPPYKSSFSKEDSQKMIEEINLFQPDVLFVGMTAPKQEKWAIKHCSLVNAGIICSIGAVFDFYAGKVKRPGDVWISLGLEWLGRLIKEPKRLYKRYLYYGPVFVFWVLKEKVKSKRKIYANNVLQKDQGL